MEAWERIALACDATLAVVGAGPESRRVEHWAQTTRSADRVRLFGARPDVDTFYRAADVLLVPSRTETFSNVMAEAMARGLAVVTTPVGLATHWIRAGQSGIVVPGRDAQQIADAAIGLVRDPDRRRELGRGARQEALASFSAASVLERHIELYGRLVGVADVAAAA
jgi:glycosyltransferase involved in cell wall biosynthesis